MSGEGSIEMKKKEKEHAHDAHQRRSSILASSAMAVRSTFRALELDSVGNAVPIIASPGAAGPASILTSWTTQRASQAAYYAQADARVPSAEAPPRVKTLALLSYSTHKERWLMVLGLLAAAISGLAMPVWLLLLAQSLETFNNIGKLLRTFDGEQVLEILKDQLLQLVWSFAVVGAVSLVSGSLYVALWTYTGEKQTLRIREKFVRAAFRQESAWFDTTTGDPQKLPTLAANALAKIGEGIGRQMADAFANLLAAVCCLAVAMSLNAPLALIMLCILPIVATCIAIVSCFMRQKSGQALEHFASAGAFATEVISGIKTITSLCATSWAVARYERMVRSGQQFSVQSGFLSSLTAGVTGLLFYCTYTVAFIFGTEQVARTGEEERSHRNPFYCVLNYCGITGSEVMVCIYGVILCAQFFALMTPGIQAINRGRQAAVDIFGAIKRTPAIDATSDDDGVKLENYDGSIELQKVAFAYPSRPTDLIFNNFNLRIAPGSSVALVGPSGSGKSTISKLLLRLYDPVWGHVLADGVPLQDVNLKWWRSRVGYVPQEPSLFPGTIRDNIAMGKPNKGGGGEEAPAPAPSDKEVIAAAKAACAHEFITELPDGYDTFYSGSSIQLSGGQIQRIAIARAIIRDPAILLLDEATSALDSQSEKAVQEAIESIRQIKKLTTVTVAHRLSTIVSSDQIAVISGGCIEELGTHESLLKEGGIYATLCQSQGITLDATTGGVTGATSLQAGGNGSSSAKDTDKNRSAAVIYSGSKDDIEAAMHTPDVAVEATIEKSESEEEANELDEEEEETAPLSRLWEYNKPEWAYMILGMVGGCVVGALHPCEGILFAQITANFFVLDPDPMRAENRKLSLCFLALAGASLLGNMALGCGFSVSGFRLTRRMRVLVFEKIVRHSMGWFDFPEHSTGELTSRLEEDAEAVSKVTGWSLGYQIQVIAALTSGVIISLVYSWQIGLIAIGCIPFIMLAALLQAKCSRHRVAEQQGLSSATILEQGLRQISLVQAYNLQEDVANNYSEALKPDAAYKVKQGAIAGLVFGCTQFAIFATFALLFYAGIRLMVSGKATFASFFTSLLAIMFAAFGVGQVNADFNSQHKGLAAAARIFAVVDVPLDSADPLSNEGSRPGSLDGTVTFQSCCFNYPTRPGHPIYYPSEGRDGFNLSILSKESVAFVGKSGCGKSTALQLLLRFYDVSSGQVLLDSNNVQELNVSWLRGNVGYVGQQPVLFAGTVRENILLGNETATEEEITSAAKAANAHDFIMHLSDGYDTDIGAGGSLLSGGQKQRIAIARAVVKNPPMLVLDEATSALDNESESVVQAALDDMQQKQPRTTLVVAHRLMTVKQCDKIAVLDNGGVKELGSHSSLLEQKGLYYDLWMKQGSEKPKEE